MSDAVKIALMSNIGSIVAALISGLVVFMVAKMGKKVDGNLSKLATTLQELAEEKARAQGELAGRDYIRQHIEARQDAQAAKEVKL